MARPKPAVSTGVPTALIYTRVSLDDMAREGLSLPVQLAEARRYAADRGWVLGTEYQDVMKGTRDDRPDYQRLLADVRAMRADGQPVVVVVAALDRFGRRLLERVRSREELTRLGVSVHSVREGGEVSDLMANILGSVAQEEVRRLGERVSAVIRHTTDSGWYFPGKVPWGYRLREATADERRAGAPRMVLDVDEERAVYVRELFARAADRSPNAAARWAQTLPAGLRNGRGFAPNAVRKMLDNPAYVARPRRGDAAVLARPLSRWPQVVSDEAFRRVEVRIAEHARRPHQATNRYLLTGLLRCPACGTRMTGTSTAGQEPRYRCRAGSYGTTVANPSCTWTARARATDEAVLARVVPLVEAIASADRDFRSALREAWHRLNTAGQGEDTGKLAKQLERRAQKGRDRLREAARMLVDKEIDREGYELVRDEAKGDIEHAEAELARLRTEPARADLLPDIGTVLAKVGGWGAVLAGPDVDEHRGAVAGLVERVVPVRTGYDTIDVELVWTPIGDRLRAALAASPAAFAA